MAKKKGRTPYSLLTINGELQLIQSILQALDDYLYVLPKKRTPKYGTIDTYPVLPFSVDKAVAQRSNTLNDTKELFSLIDALVPHARPIVFIAAMTGLRKGNVLNLKVQSCDLANGTFTVIQKGGRPHTVPIHQALYPLIEGLIDGRTRGPLFQYGMYGCDCNFCSDYRKPATSGKAHYVAGQDRKWTEKRVRCIETGETFADQTDARNKLVRRDHLRVGSAWNIGEVCRGTRKHAGGLHFEFVPAPTPIRVPNKARRHGPIKSIDSAFRTARKKIGRTDVRFHDLRHTIATWLTAGGMPLVVLAKQLGHADISTTQRYEHSDIQTVGAFLHSAVKIDIPADSSEGISENTPLKLEQNPNNNAPQTRPKTEDSPSVLSPQSISP